MCQSPRRGAWGTGMKENEQVPADVPGGQRITDRPVSNVVAGGVEGWGEHEATRGTESVGSSADRMVVSESFPEEEMFKQTLDKC